MLNKLVFVLSITIMGCAVSENSAVESSEEEHSVLSIAVDSLVYESEPTQTQEPSDTSFVNIASYSNDFAFEMRYATDNNFLEKKVYDCSNCLMRYEVAKAIIMANDSLNKLGYKVKFFDCFRPVEVQRKMWEIYPDARYVANPYTSGSVHNKGAALDITLLTLEDEFVDMGTDFDYFGEEAHHSYINFTEKVLNNRRTLKSVMESFGFAAIRTEWWHYNYEKSSKYPISNQKLCE